MNNSRSSIFDKAVDPIYQALLCLGTALLVTMGGKLVGFTGLMTISNRFPWMTSAAFMLFFAMFNSIYSLSAKNTAQYWGRSIYSFMGLALLSGLMAYLFSSLSINEAGSYRWIYFVLTLGYLVFLTIVTLMRNIVEFAQREEWNQPRIRQKNRKK
ncbi:MAG: hypothetical protein SFU99_14145 [Saprospiraceae bacterium]|nr:hypothetical protein [Saprospiraceae bacterium]